MDKELKDKVDKLTKSMYKSINKLKAANAIKDVLDSDRVAEMDEDEVAVGSTNAMHKSKKKKKEDEMECSCKGESEKDCECDEEISEPVGIEKTETFVKEFIGNFKKISNAYLNKKR